MAGLFGAMLAGAAGTAAKGKVREIENQEKFSMEQALLDARLEKEVQLKKLGYEMEDARTASKNAQRAEYFKDVEETSTTPESVINKYTDDKGVEQTVKAGGETITKARPATMEDAAERAIKAGDFETGEGLLKMTPKKEKSFESVKLDDGSVLSFDKSNGTHQVIIKGGGVMNVPKNEFELAWRESGGDPKLAGEIIVKQKARVAAAGRAPERASDDDLTFADWKRKPENKGKGRDDYAKEKASWNKSDPLDTVTESETQYNDDGSEKKVSRTSKVPSKPKQTGALKKDKSGNYVFTR
jgi:hypothetical protein